jgi:DHA3 family macrolide efflux protein-like MFS transporter
VSNLDQPPATAPTADAAPLGRRFLTVWAGQTVSTIGSGLTAVGIAVYVFVLTDSLAWLGLLTAVEALPVLLMSPLLGLTDRRDRRTVMIRADVFAAVGPAIALVIALLGTIQPWQLAVAGFLGGIGTAFQVPAYQAAVPNLVDEPALGRANGLVQLGPAAAMVLAPAAATAIIARWGITALLVADLVTFGVGLGATVMTKFSAATPPPADDDGSNRAAFNWLRRDGRGLLLLLVAMACINFVMAFFNLAFFALAVDLGGVAKAGLAPAAGGATMIVASLVVGHLGIPARRMRAVATAIAVMAVACVVAAARPSFALLMIGAAIALATVPVVSAIISTVFHERVPQSMHGRVFGLRNVLGQALYPVGSIAAGLIGANIATPAMTSDGAFAASIGRVIGVGADRGAALMLLGVAVGLVILIMPLIVHPEIRSLDLDDAAVDSESTDLTGRPAPLSTVPS